MTNDTAHPQRFHGVTTAAQLVGMTRQHFLRVGPPAPDVLIDETRGWTEATLRHWAETRPNRQRIISQATREAVRADLKAGGTVTEIARARGVSQPVVSKIKAAMGTEEGR